MPKGKLKAKGTVTQGTRVEEPKGPDHQFLCTKEVGTPKASFNRGKNMIFYEVLVESTGKGQKTTPKDAKSEKMEPQGE